MIDLPGGVREFASRARRLGDWCFRGRSPLLGDALFLAAGEEGCGEEGCDDQAFKEHLGIHPGGE